MITEDYDVFLSHSHRDEARVRALNKQLVEWGITVFVDYDDLMLSELPDRRLADRLVQKLRLCRLLIFAFSEDALVSRWMPWELGLAHGVIGRVVLWPFTKRALEAAATKEYLSLYEAQDPTDPATARDRLQVILDAARTSAIKPADEAMMRDQGRRTANKSQDFRDPEVAGEYMSYGPMKLYSAWLEALTQAWRP